MPQSYVRRCVLRSGGLRDPCEWEQQVHPTKKKDNTAARNMANEHRCCDILSLFDFKSGSDTRYSHKKSISSNFILTRFRESDNTKNAVKRSAFSRIGRYGVSGILYPMHRTSFCSSEGLERTESDGWIGKTSGSSRSELTGVLFLKFFLEKNSLFC